MLCVVRLLSLCTYHAPPPPSQFCSSILCLICIVLCAARPRFSSFVHLISAPRWIAQPFCHATACYESGPGRRGVRLGLVVPPSWTKGVERMCVRTVKARYVVPVDVSPLSTCSFAFTCEVLEQCFPPEKPKSLSRTGAALDPLSCLSLSSVLPLGPCFDLFSFRVPLGLMVGHTLNLTTHFMPKCRNTPFSMLNI